MKGQVVNSRDRFPTTHWSLVVEAGTDSGDARRDALGRLLHNYMPPMHTYLVTVKRFVPQQAEDLLQSFVADQILERHLLRSATQNRGRFRAFIVTALNNYCSNQRRDARAKKRAPKHLAAIDDTINIADPVLEPSAVFDLAWAKQVLDQATELMRTECNHSRPKLWQIFEVRVLEPALRGTEPLPYAQMIERFGFKSPTQAANAVVTANRMFARMLRRVIGQYEQDAERVEEEIRDLRRTIAGLAAKSTRMQ
jgi:hypothetical protein